MARKTINIKLDAYDKLRLSKRPGESFTEIVRRARFDDAPVTGARLLEYLRKGGGGVSEHYLDAMEAAGKNDQPPDYPVA